MSSDRTPLLAASNLSKQYKSRVWTLRRSWSGVAALQDVSVTVARGRTVGIVGESGAGKSTLARCIAALEAPDAGRICLDGQNLLEMRPADFRRARRRIQMIFQGSAASLNPGFSAIEAVTEPARIARAGSRASQREAALSLMESVGLARTLANRTCTEFSGGQRQRLAIARALTTDPEVLILDESLSGLDLIIQAQLVNLLLDLQASRSMAYIFISHDLRLAAHVSDDLAVMQGGRIVEYGLTERVLQDPRHPHTRALLSAVSRFGLSR